MDDDIRMHGDPRYRDFPNYNWLRASAGPESYQALTVWSTFDQLIMAEYIDCCVSMYNDTRGDHYCADWTGYGNWISIVAWIDDSHSHIPQKFNYIDGWEIIDDIPGDDIRRVVSWFMQNVPVQVKKI